MLKKLFPDLFMEGVAFINFGEYRVTISKEYKKSVVIYGPWPNTFLIDKLEEKNIPLDVIDDEIVTTQKWHDIIIVTET